MTKAQKRQRDTERREIKRRNRERCLKNRRNWTRAGGPVLVMEDPTEEHIKALLTDWLPTQQRGGIYEEDTTDYVKFDARTQILDATKLVFDASAVERQVAERIADCVIRKHPVLGAAMKTCGWGLR